MRAAPIRETNRNPKRHWPGSWILCWVLGCDYWTQTAHWPDGTYWSRSECNRCGDLTEHFPDLGPPEPRAAALAVVMLTRYTAMLSKLVMDTPKDQRTTDEMVELGNLCARHITSTLGGITEWERAAAGDRMQRMVNEVVK